MLLCVEGLPALRLVVILKEKVGIHRWSALIDRFGTSQSFLIYAAFALPLCGLLALIIRRVQQADNGYGPGR